MARPSLDEIKRMSGERFMQKTEERVDGPTPAGGAYAIARFSRDGEAAAKDCATEVELIEYAADGREIQRTYGILPAGQ